LICVLTGFEIESVNYNLMLGLFLVS
jgi:hypothetical protein